MFNSQSSIPIRADENWELNIENFPLPLVLSALLAGFPGCEIATEYEEFSTDLNDRDGVFFYDSAEVPQREASQIGGRWNIHKHFGFLCCCVNRLAKHVLIPPLSV